MGSRTTANLVRGVLRDGTKGGDYDDVNVPDLEPYITAANLTVNRVQAMALAKGITLTADELNEIERWVAAHNYCCSDKTYSSKSTMGSSGSFQGQTGQGYESTYYGQTALRLDYSNSLENIDKKQRARTVWLGKRVSEQIPYTQRD